MLRGLRGFNTGLVEGTQGMIMVPGHWQPTVDLKVQDFGGKMKRIAKPVK